MPPSITIPSIWAKTVLDKLEPARLREKADAMEGKIDRMPIRQIFRDLHNALGSSFDE